MPDGSFIDSEDAFLAVPLPGEWLPAPIPCPDGAFRGPGWLASRSCPVAVHVPTYRLAGVLHAAGK